jgi:radial spoke head protein 4A
VNKTVFWVSSNTFETWTLLPDLSPNDLAQSRAIKVNFTGDLEREIITNPFFVGREKHYLRAQIARISHSTTLIPAGQFRTTEDNDKEIEQIGEEDGFKILSTEELTSTDNWQHVSQSILKAHRVTH